MEKRPDVKIAGIIIFIAVSEFFLSMLVAESTYKGYSVSNNYISDLGVGSTANLFNVSIIVMGLLIIVAAALLRTYSRSVTVTLIIAGIGAMGVGLFPETTGTPHGIFSLIVFFFASISAYMVLAREKRPVAILFAVMGSISLVSLILYGMDIFLSLGKGGMERMIAYPDLIWVAAFGALLTSR